MVSVVNNLVFTMVGSPDGNRATRERGGVHNSGRRRKRATKAKQEKAVENTSLETHPKLEKNNKRAPLRSSFTKREREKKEQR